MLCGILPRLLLVIFFVGFGSAMTPPKRTDRFERERVRERERERKREREKL